MKKNNLKEVTIFSKIKSFIFNNFKKGNYESSIKNEQAPIDTPLNSKFSNFFEEQNQKIERRNYLIQLQHKYENGNIKESEINETDKKELEELYKENIIELKRKINAIDIKLKRQ